MPQRSRLRRAWDAIRGVEDRRQNSGYGGIITGGGLVNTGSGLGMPGLDKSEGSFWTPTRFWWRSPLELLYVQSAAARKFVNLPIEDMFIRWRMWTSEEEGVVKRMTDAEKRHKVTKKLSQAMRASRAYGTAIMILMTREAPLTEELVPERIRPGDLSALRVFDRYDLSVTERETDPYAPGYPGPRLYNVHPTSGYSLPFKVHASRVLRFDGIEPLAESRFYNYEQDWSVSELVPAIISLIEDQTLASAIAHMSQEASIPVLGVADLREILAGRAGRSEATVEQIGGAINRIKSVFRLMMLDKNREEFSRVAIQFAGLADLMDKFGERLAEMIPMPLTRWKGRSPAGLNATGESDMKNYVMLVEANREKRLEHILPLLDLIVARDAGLPEAPEFEWQSLLEISDKEKAEVADLKVKAVKTAIEAVVIDEEDGRRILDGDPVFGALPGDPPEPPELPPPAGGGPGGPDNPEPPGDDV